MSRVMKVVGNIVLILVMLVLIRACTQVLNGKTAGAPDANAVSSVQDVAEAIQKELTGQDWHVVEQTDKVSGEKSTEVQATVVADDGGSFDLAVACMPGFINLTLTDNATDAKIEPQQTQDGGQAYFLRTRLDGGEVTSARSDIAYTNVATIMFYDPVIGPKVMAAAAAPGGTGDADGKESGGFVASLFNGFANALAGPLLASTAAGTIGDFEKSKTLTVEVPLADGKKPTLTIPLGSDALRSYAAQCDRDALARFPPPPPPPPPPAADQSSAPADNTAAQSATPEQSSPDNTTS